MKNLLLPLLMMISVITFANNPETGHKVSPRLKASLEKEFAGAQGIVWEALEEHELFHARFIYNNERLNAFFGKEGELIATGRYINTAIIPMNITRQVAVKYNNYEIKDVIEYSRNGETSYVISLQNEKHRIVLEAYSSGNMYVFKKEKKNSAAKL
jgi:hypothetical protein